MKNFNSEKDVTTLDKLKILKFRLQLRLTFHKFGKYYLDIVKEELQKEYKRRKYNEKV